MVKRTKITKKRQGFAYFFKKTGAQLVQCSKQKDRGLGTYNGSGSIFAS